MKNLFLSLAAGTLIAVMTACSADTNPLSESSAESALKKEAIFAKDSQVKTFALGFQEVSTNELNQLARLKAAGLVEYTTETVVEKRRVRQWGGYWNPPTVVIQETPHTFADVKLTPEGEKYIIAEPTIYRDDLAKDLKVNKDYSEAVPDYMSATHGVEPTATTVDNEINDIIEETDVEEISEPDDFTEVVEEEVSTSAPDNINAAYERMCARVNIENVNVLLGRYEIVSVKEISCTEDMYKAGKGSCKVFYKFVDKTPFGFVLGAPDENYVNSNTVSFVLYQDLGWVVN